MATTVDSHLGAWWDTPLPPKGGNHRYGQRPEQQFNFRAGTTRSSHQGYGEEGQTASRPAQETSSSFSRCSEMFTPAASYAGVSASGGEAASERTSWPIFHCLNTPPRALQSSSGAKLLPLSTFNFGELSYLHSNVINPLLRPI